MINYYTVLGVSRTSSKEEVKGAYKKLAREYHPDKNNGDDTKFKEISEAHDILSDETKRKAYDAKMNFSFDFNRWGQAFGESTTAEDFHKTGKPEAPKGPDIHQEVVVTLDEILNGVKKEVTYHALRPCYSCDSSGAKTLKACILCKGHGTVREKKTNIFGSSLEVVVCKKCWGSAVEVDLPCTTCKGDGRISEEEVTNVNIPAGVKNKNFINVVGKGSAGKRGGTRGNLIVDIVEELPQNITRKGSDLYMEHEITLTEAVLGTTIKVNTPKKTVELKIKPATQSGTLLKIKNGGIFKGSLYVQVKVLIPELYSDEQRQLFVRLSEIDKEFSFEDE